MRRRNLDRIIDECINREVMNSRRYANNYGYIDEGFMDTRMGKAMGRGISKAGMGIGNRLSKWGNSLSNVASNYGRRFANTGSNGGNQTGNQPSYQENPLPTGNNNTNYNDPDDDDEEEMTNQTNSDNGANYDEEDTDNNQAGSDNDSNYDEGDDDNTQAGSDDYGQPQGNANGYSNDDEDDYDEDDDDNTQAGSDDYGQPQGNANGYSNDDEDDYDEDDNDAGYGEAGNVAPQQRVRTPRGPRMTPDQRKYKGMIRRVDKNIPVMDQDITDLTHDGYINRNIGNYAINGLKKVKKNIDLANNRNMGTEKRQRAQRQPDYQHIQARKFEQQWRQQQKANQMSNNQMSDSMRW